jgi:hypothetical protein
MNGMYKRELKHNLGEGDFCGDWVTIQLPDQIYLTKSTFTARAPGSAPNILKIYGSNDGKKWKLVHHQTSTSYHDNVATVSINEKELYSHFGLVVAGLSGYKSTLNFMNWGIFGIQRDKNKVCCSWRLQLGIMISACLC